MVNYYKLDKILKVGETYQTPPDRFLIIQKIGTDAATDAYLKIDGVDTGAITSTVAPLHKTSDNLLGPLDLGSLYYIVPPDKTFWVEGPSGAKFRIIGKIGHLAPGEAMPADLLGRFNAQGKHFITYAEGTGSLGTDESWADGREIDVYSITPKTNEQYIFNKVAMASIIGGSITEGQVALRLYYDGTPLDFLTATAGHKGIDILSMPRPPTDSTEETAFSFEDLALTVLGDHTLAVKAVNVSGSALTPDSGSAWSVTFTAIVEYQQK